MCSGHPHTCAEPWPGVLCISTEHHTSVLPEKVCFALKCSQGNADCTLLSPQGKAGTLSRVLSQQLLSPRLTTGQSCTPSMATSMAHCLVSPAGTGTGLGAWELLGAGLEPGL